MRYIGGNQQPIQKTILYKLYGSENMMRSQISARFKWAVARAFLGRSFFLH
jgi:hypothetical protein